MLGTHTDIPFTLDSEGTIAPDDLYVEEDISADILWGTPESPIYINDTITVDDGVRLTIDTGVTVRFGIGAHLIVNGSIHVGGTGDPVILRPQGAVSPGSWGGVILKDCDGATWNNVRIQGANTSIMIDNSSHIDVKNTTFLSDSISISLTNGSRVSVGNCSLNISRTSILDNNSSLLTYGYLTAYVVNYRSQTEDGFKFELIDINDDLVRSYILDRSGIVPTDLIKGRTLTSEGWNSSSGTYTASITNSSSSFIRNISFMMKDHDPMNVTFRYFRSPEIFGLPTNLSVDEDRFQNVHVEMIDHNGVGETFVTISNPAITFDQDSSSFSFYYPNETILQEILKINISDGYDSTRYDLNVTVNPRDDPLHMDLDMDHIIIRENTRYDLDLTITDEDTDVKDIDVSTDDPGNISFDRGNMSLSLLYGDGTSPEFDINISATDGTSHAFATLNISFQAVNYKPEFLEPLPDITLYEDNGTSIDLGPYVYDPDQLDTVVLTAQSLDLDLFGAAIDGTVLSIIPMRDRSGTGSVRVTATDSRSYSSVVNINVTMIPVNDAPTLTKPGVQDLGRGTFMFNITYSDIEGDIPVLMQIEIDKKTYNMIPLGSRGPDPVDGIPYYLIKDLDAGIHIYRFICSDGEMEVSTPSGELISEVHYDIFYLEGYGGALNITIWTTGDGSIPFIEADLPVEGSPDNKVFIGCSFIIRSNDRGISTASIRLDLSFFRKDILPLETDAWYHNGTGWARILGGMYSSLTGIYTLDLTDEPFSEIVAFFSGLDPDHDEDGDSVPDRIDAFPHDPTEWSDTDGDGVGDNRDDDDDNDGYNDTVEILAGSSPYNPDSIPLDTDGDGLIDIFDDDDDGDGMPDSWEIENGLDPLNGTDAEKDNDGDGLSNLDEYLQGKDPNRKDVEKDEEGDWLYLWIGSGLVAFLLIIIIIAAILSRHHREEMDEIEFDDGEISDDEWEIRGELDHSDAVECDSCSGAYPRDMDKCPFCGSRERTSLSDSAIME